MKVGCLAFLRDTLEDENFYVLYCSNNVEREVVVIMGIYDIYADGYIISFTSLVTGEEHWMQKDEFEECFDVIYTEENNEQNKRYNRGCDRGNSIHPEQLDK